MLDTFKFPNGGYEVKVYRKEDIIKCIDDNIVDKELVLEVISRCEIGANNYIKQGKWTSIPHIGSIRVPKVRAALIKDGNVELFKAAKQEMDENRYYLFRKRTIADIAEKEKRETLYKYETSRAVRKNAKLFRKIATERGELYARLYFYLTRKLNDASNDGYKTYSR